MRAIALTPSHRRPTMAPVTAPALSVSIVCFNAERTIARVLDSVAGLADEVVALDSGSTDATREILRSRPGVTLVDQPWLGYVKQKQAALDRCTRPWVLHLDADESLEPRLRDEVRTALERDDSAVAGYELNRKVWYAGRFLKHAWQPEYRLRLVRRERAAWAGYDPHDRMEILPGSPSRVERLSGDIRHECVPSIAEFLARQASHARTAAAALAERGRSGSVARLVFSPVGEFAKQVVVRGAWRDGWRGWVASSASSVAVAMKHAALIEATRPNGSERRP